MNLIQTSPPATAAPRLTIPESDLLAWLDRLKKSTALTCALLFFLSFSSCLLFAAFKGWPIPSLHDEYSYLLAADTFAEGRLSNPSHPLAAHFETFHVLQHPSYSSKYPPLPGLLLALGQLLGHPALGIYIISALTVAGIYWALRELFSHLWSLFGSFLAWSQFAPYSFYSFSYMGGNSSALGACLLLGAALRLLSRTDPSPRHAVLLSLGAFVLAASRPFEGFILCSLTGLLLSAHFLLSLSPALRRLWLTRLFPPAALVMILGAAFILFHNYRVTGHAFDLPYSAYENSHSNTPLFIPGTPRAATLPDTPHLREFEKQFTVAGFLEQGKKSYWQRFGERCQIALEAFIPWWFPGIILLLLSATSSRPWTWFAWSAIFLVIAACSFTVWFSPHYLGGLLPFFCLLAVTGAVQLSRFRCSGHAWGFHLLRTSIWFLFFLQVTATLVAPAAMARAEPFASRRLAIQHKLESLPGPDLILVSYGPRASVHEEWVYNRADIDHAPVVWAHSLDPAQDQKLMNYFSNRRIWRLQVDEKASEPVEISAFPDASGNRTK